MANIILGSYVFVVFSAIGVVHGAATMARRERIAWKQRMKGL